MSEGFAFHVDGSPYVWTTPGVTSTPSGAEWPTGAVLVVGGLKSPLGDDEGNGGISWQERMQPLDTALEVDGISVEIEDMTVTSGPASGYPVVTWCSTKRLGQITNTELAASLSSSALSFTVVAGTGANFPSGSQVVHIDREAILCDSRAADTFTVNAAGRGYLGTLASAHTVDATTSYAPTVFADFPGFTRRRCCLWRVVDGVGTILYRGYCMRAPRLSKNKASYELQLESAWTVERSLPLGIPTATTNIRGYDTNGGTITLHRASDGGTYFLSRFDTWSSPRIVSTYGQFLGAIHDRFIRDANTAGLATNINGVTFRQTSTGVHFTGSTNGLGATGWSVFLGTAFDAMQGRATGEPYTTDLDISYAPQVLATFNPYNSVAEIAIDSTFGFPSSWVASAPSIDDGFATQVTAILRGSYDDETWLVLRPSSHASTGTNAPSVTGYVMLTSKKTDQIVFGSVGGGRSDPYAIWRDHYMAIPGLACFGIIDRPIAFALTAFIDTGHWFYGISNAIIGDGTFVRSGADSRNWDFTNGGRITRYTGGDTAFTGRRWYLDGSETVGDVIANQCRLAGCGLATRNGRLSIVPYSQPLPTDAVVATLTADDFVDREQPDWTLFPDGLANVVSVSGDSGAIVLRDQRSISMFGSARNVEIKLMGASIGFGAIDPTELANYVMHRVMGLWGRPCALLSFKVSLDYASVIQLGDYVSISDPRLPDGTGNRSATARVVQIIGRRVVLGGSDTGHIEFEGVDFNADRLAGYSPCVRIASIAGAVLTVDTGYLSSSNTDYAGSNLSSYAGTANDGGTSTIGAGYKMRFIQRDTTSLVTENVTVLSVNAAAKTITLTAPPATVIGAGEKWDLIAQGYGNGTVLTAAQEQYATCGNDSGNVIGTSADRANVWAA